MGVHFSPPALRRVIGAAMLASVLAVMTLGAAASAAQAEEHSDGIGITIDVLGPTARPTPHPTNPPVGSGHGSGGGLGAGNGNGSGAGSGSGAVRESTPATPADAEQALGEEPFDLGGILQLSGLSASTAPTVLPHGGDMALTFTAKSAAETPIDVDLRFWVTNVFGATVAEVRQGDSTPLAPAETRTFTATIPDVGQWGVYTAHVTLTPPEKVDGVDLVPITRDATVIVPPLFAAAVLLIAALFGVALFGVPGAAGFPGLVSLLRGTGRLPVGGEAG